MDSIIQFLLSVSPTLVSKHVFLFLFAEVSLEIGLLILEVILFHIFESGMK